MRPPINRHIKSIISNRAYASKIVREIVEHDSKKDAGSEIVIKFDNDEELVLGEVGTHKILET